MKIFYWRILLNVFCEFLKLLCFIILHHLQNSHLGILCNPFDRGAVGPYRKLAAVAVTPDDFPEGCEGLTLQSLLHRRSSTVYALINVHNIRTILFIFLFQHKVVANIYDFLPSFKKFN